MLNNFFLIGTAFADPYPLRIYAAASLTSVMKKISKVGTEQNLPAVMFVHAASSTLARQIEHGAPADIYISANLEWVNYLTTRKYTNAVPRTFASNKLVLITPMDRPINFSFTENMSLAELVKGEWVALADPDHVPAGKYASIALRTFGYWHELKSQIARTSNVRAALALVIRGEARAGIVYLSDALNEKRVRIEATFPSYSHPKIRYAAIDLTSSIESDLYMNFLASQTVARILENQGFYP